ncbi:MAG: histidine phosphatase family protein [Armatimonadota bacterium]
MTTTIYLLRHAEMAANVPGHGSDGALTRPSDLLYGAFENAPLTRRGEQQAEWAAEGVASYRLVAAYASPYRRAVMTAAAAARPHDLTVIPDDALVERHFGEWDGLTAGEIAERDPPGVALFDSSPTFAPPDGESLEAVVERAYPALEDVARRHAGEAVLVVSHKTVIRAVMCHILGMPLESYRRIGQHNCALNVLHIGGERIDVALINDTCHLERSGSQCG